MIGIVGFKLIILKCSVMIKKDMNVYHTFMVINVKKLIKIVGEKSYSYHQLNVKKMSLVTKISIFYHHAQMMI